MPNYDILYAELKGKFEDEISQNVNSVIQHVCNICVYLDDLSSKGIAVDFPFWGKTKFWGSTTFPHKLSHFKRILSGLTRKHYSNFCDMPQSTEFNAIVTGSSNFKVSKQYKQLVIELIDTVYTLKNNEKENCLQICKNFVDEQFPDTSMTNSNHPNCSI